jgi:hypothetical protein
MARAGENDSYNTQTYTYTLQKRITVAAEEGV